jgi:tRNA(guanine-26,N2-N2) methyltransferase
MAASSEASGLRPDTGKVVSPFWTPPPGFQTITEGSATALYPEGRAVFYNPAQVYNRDLSIAALRVLSRERRLQWQDPKVASSEVRRRHARSKLAGDDFAPPILHRLFDPVSEEVLALAEEESPSVSAWLGVEVSEPLAATGLRSMRYGTEVNGLSTILVSDLDSAAVKACTANVEFNNLDPSVVRPLQADAVKLLRLLGSHAFQVDWVDLDPYGSPSPFIEAGLGAVTNGGILAVTATDMMVLAGRMLHSAHSKYGTVLARTSLCQELALRTIIFAVATAASRQGRTVEPLISLNADFYVRILFRVRDSRSGAQLLPVLTGSLGLCSQCETRQWQPTATASELGSSKKKKHHSDDSEAASSSEQQAALRERARGRSLFEARAQALGLARSGRPDSDVGQQAVMAEHVHLSSACPSCGGAMRVLGPFWTGPLHSPGFVRAVSRELESLTDAGFPLSDADGRSALLPDRAVPSPGVPGVTEGCLSGEAPDAGSNSAETVQRSRDRLKGTLSVIASELGGEEVEAMYRRWEGTPELQGLAGTATFAGEPRTDLSKDTDTVMSVAGSVSGLASASLRPAPLESLLYWDPAKFASKVRLPVPSRRALATALMNEGYRISDTHCAGGAFKTDAPSSLVWDVIRVLGAAQIAPDNAPKREGVITAELSHHDITADPRSAAVAAQVAAFVGKDPDGPKRPARFVANPRDNWGPQTRATGEPDPKRTKLSCDACSDSE